MEQRKTISTLNYATTAIVAASTGMVLARPESPLLRRQSGVSSTPSSQVNSRLSLSPFASSRENSPYPIHRVSISPSNGSSPLSQSTGWINNSPQKASSPLPYHREGTPLSTSELLSSPTSSGKKPAKLRRRQSSKSPGPFFGWRGKSKSPPIEALPTPQPANVTVHEDEEHYHLYDADATRLTTTTRSFNPRHSIASMHSIAAGNTPRTPLKRIYPPPQQKDSPRLISPNSLCQVPVCNGTPPREQLLVRALRRMTSEGNLSPTRSPGHQRGQSVPSIDSVNNTPTRDTQAWTNGTSSRKERTVWLVDEDNPTQEDKFGSEARRRLDFSPETTRPLSTSSYKQRMSQSPAPIPERCDSLNWDSESDPTYDSMKTEESSQPRKSRLSSVFDDSELEMVTIPEDKVPDTKVTLLSRDNSLEDLDWGESPPRLNGHPNIKRRLPTSAEMKDLYIPERSTSLSRSKSVPPQRPNPSPEKTKRLSAPKECWDNDFEDEGSDMWMIPETITDAQDKLKGYLSNIRTFSTVIEDLKRFRQSHPRTHHRRVSQEQLLDEVDAMIEISTLDGFTTQAGPPLSPKKSTPSLASSQWSFEDRFNTFATDDERSLPTPPPQPSELPELDAKDLQARRLLEKILGESNELRMEVKPEQLTKMIEYVNALKDRCEKFDSHQGVASKKVSQWNNIGLGVFV